MIHHKVVISGPLFEMPILLLINIELLDYIYFWDERLLLCGDVTLIPI